MNKRMAPPSYIEMVAQAIYDATGNPEDLEFPGEEAALWLGYAVLCLTKGTETTSRDVHEAWSAWATVEYDGTHRSLIPFDELMPEVQAYDDLYRDAIHQVSLQVGGWHAAYRSHFPASFDVEK